MANLNRSLRFSIEANDDEECDELRAKAFLRFREREAILVDVCPYKSVHLGLCQLVVVYKQVSHVLVLRLYEAKDTVDEALKCLRMNREIRLADWGISKLQRVQDCKDFSEAAPEDDSDLDLGA